MNEPPRKRGMVPETRAAKMLRMCLTAPCYSEKEEKNIPTKRVTSTYRTPFLLEASSSDELPLSENMNLEEPSVPTNMQMQRIEEEGDQLLPLAYEHPLLLLEETLGEPSSVLDEVIIEESASHEELGEPTFVWNENIIGESASLEDQANEGVVLIVVPSATGQVENDSEIPDNVPVPRENPNVTAQCEGQDLVDNTIVQNIISEENAEDNDSGQSPIETGLLNDDQSENDPTYQPDDEEHDDMSDEDSVEIVALQSDDVVPSITPEKNQGDNQSAEAEKMKHRRTGDKIKKCQGKEYVKRNGNVCPAKAFEPLIDCCKKECCKKIPIEKQESIFKDFYNISDTNNQNQIIADRLELIQPVHVLSRSGNTKTGTTKDRIVTVKYKIEGYDFACKKTFQSIYGLSRGKIDVLVNKKKASTTGIIQKDLRGSHTPHNKNEAETAAVISHINSIPRYDSHYSRRHTSKQYFSSQLNIAKLHELYTELRKEEGAVPLSYPTYARIFATLGYKFKAPSIDTCKTCDQLKLQIAGASDPEAKLALEQEKNTHLDNADIAYSQKKEDKLWSREEPELRRMICFDLQQCLPTPDLGSNIVYYKRQLWTYNLTIRDCTDSTSHCYMWHEGIGRRGSDDIASCVMNYLQNLSPGIEVVIAYSDSCPGQNKNINMASAVSYFTSKSTTLNTVDHKFLVPGHTRMECDADHAQIEKAKNRANFKVRVLQEWYQLVRTVRGKKQFLVHEMTQDNLFSYSSLIGKDRPLVKRTVNTDGEEVNWHRIRWFRYEKVFGVIKYKETLDIAEPFKTLDLRRNKRGRPSGDISIPLSYSGPLPINPAKKKDLLELVGLIDPIFHGFYEGLVTNKNASLAGDWAELDDDGSV